jgi:hypothetical protein
LAVHGGPRFLQIADVLRTAMVDGSLNTCIAAPKVTLTSILDLSMNTATPPDGVDFDAILKQGLFQVLMGS